ncbi:helix-turn-helix domain-containing protein [Microbulbifer halophilus]|uniref:Helix-turn-helix domain-containing protein n=1 Tax=Microbulbifer halophilus TaxID=453963 RepID=A0ABW5EC72_9GAMM|nr:helix-turn-helix domain-containing protein [Microbulbifer halophilus]MCW8126551.1 helix-turn-helix domain-containing protein [Microbulbifer halophilus]
MKGVLFNIHDVALLLIAGEFGILSVLLLARRGVRPLAHPLLAMFLVLNMLIAVDTLIYWGVAVRYRVFHISPDLFFLFGFAYFLQGPALYWYTRSIICKDYSFRRLDLLHLVPAVAAQVYLYFVYHRYPAAVQGDLVLGLEIFTFTAGYHDIFVTAQKSIVLVYAIACVFQVVRHRAFLKDSLSNIDLDWLHLLIGGFLLAWVWSLVTHIFGLLRPGDISDMMGVAGNYMIFVLVNTLVLYSLAYSGVSEGISRGEKRDQYEERVPIDPIHVDRILATMESGRLFLNPRLTVEDFAGHVELPPRQVSSVIKHRFGRNFLEYVNSYRVEEAKRGLADPSNRHDSVLDIASKSGFNSKATFNRFFKKFAGVTPTEYRRRCLSGQTG